MAKVIITNIRVTGAKLSGAGMFDKADPYAYFYIDTPGMGGAKGQTTVLNNKPDSPSWPGEKIELEGLGKKPETLKLECSIYDKDTTNMDDKLGSFKINLAVFKANPRGHHKGKLQDNTFSKDNFLEFDYATEGWPAEEGGCCAGICNVM